MGMVFNSNRHTSTIKTADGSDSIQIPGKASISVPDHFTELPPGVSFVAVHIDDEDVSVPGAAQPRVELVDPKTPPSPQKQPAAVIEDQKKVDPSKPK